MRNFICIAALILQLSGDVKGLEPQEHREHSFTWVLAEPEKNFLVSTWIFDGLKYPDTKDGLRELKKVPISANDIICITMPTSGLKDQPTLFPAAGCILPVALHFWRNKHAKFELYREAERLKSVIISWRSEGPYDSTKNAVYQLNNDDIGDYESARNKLTKLEVNKDTIIVVFHRDKTGAQWSPRTPDPFPAPLGSWLGAGAQYAEIPDYEWPGEKIGYQGVAFPGEKAANTPASPKDSGNNGAEQKQQTNLVAPEPKE
jgi:hypothetical protein